jgi:carotenoid cleavage dioxygenase
LSEVCFVPRARSKSEGAGYLVGVASNFADMRSELIIADAEHLEDGDIAGLNLRWHVVG